MTERCDESEAETAEPDAADDGSKADRPSHPSWTDETPPELANDVDPDAVTRRIRERSETIRRRELERAVSKLDATGGLNDEQAEILAAMTDDIVDALLAAPAATLASDADEETIETAVSLFDPER